MDNQNLEGIEAISKRLGVPVSWLYSRTRTNEIPHYKMGKYVRFDVEAVERWLENYKVDTNTRQLKR